MQNIFYFYDYCLILNKKIENFAFFQINKLNCIKYNIFLHVSYITLVFINVVIKFFIKNFIIKLLIYYFNLIILQN
jgi:hypothetical protein